MISKGAEASIYLSSGKIRKERISKAYRVKALDEMLRKTRTKREARLLSLARRAGVATPFVLDVDNFDATIEMSYIQGEKLKNVLNKVSSAERKKICREIGRCAAKLHSMGVIHGDLTTSNLILSKGKIFFIDFGLGEMSEAVEDKGVDLLVFKRALRSTHYKHEKECFDAFIQGYREKYRKHEEVLERLRVIEHRGRYFEERF